MQWTIYFCGIWSNWDQKLHLFLTALWHLYTQIWFTVTVLFNFWPKGYLKRWNEVRFLILTELLLGFELAILRFWFPAWTRWPASLFCTAPFPQDMFPQVLRLNQLKMRQHNITYRSMEIDKIMKKRI